MVFGKKFTVTNNATGRSFDVEHWDEEGFDTVWLSVKSYFPRGWQVTISNRCGESKIFIK